ncbi:hypothetical protein ABF87_02720 [Nitrosomonas sp. JL21]|nr:hypothetical protein [Nitrosomonas sp. JL21]
MTLPTRILDKIFYILHWTFSTPPKGKRNLIRMSFGLWLTILIAILLQGCASSKVSIAPVAPPVHHAVKVIALAPGGGVLADAVGIELANRGFTIIDPSSTTNMLVRLNLNEVEIAKPEGLTKLREQGIDAYLVVRAAGGYDQQPQSASSRMNSTHNGQLLAGVTWQNGFGGQAGSVADRVMRKGLSEAAIDIANALVERMQ